MYFGDRVVQRDQQGSVARNLFLYWGNGTGLALERAEWRSGCRVVNRSQSTFLIEVRHV